jgi:hypothetical protein
VYDLFDDLLKQWRSPEFITTRQKEYLSEELVVTKENVNELLGEIAMYKDLMEGKITYETPEVENIDNRLAIMFSHLKQKYRDNLRNKFLATGERRPRAEHRLCGGRRREKNSVLNPDTRPKNFAPTHPDRRRHSVLVGRVKGRPYPTPQWCDFSITLVCDNAL